MRSIAIQHNMAAMNAGRMLAKKKKDKAESTEMLSTGYQINRAADDAAGLAISQKLRKMIRGLEQGTENAVDGVSWVQIGDGALEEAQAIIHRMTELSVKSANGTNSDSDRAHLDDEFTQCKKELDRISETTKFNGMRIFSKHEPAYYRCEGARYWEPDQIHVITAGKNDLSFLYSQTENGPQSTLTVTVPPGEYTTRELLDELDTLLTDKAEGSTQFFLEYTDDHRVDATLEGGLSIDKISGGLSYLLYDMNKGGSFGALIGTTIFHKEDATLEIFDGKNDYMTFSVEGFDGNTHNVTVDLDGTITTDAAGREHGVKYTRAQLIEKINEQLAAQLPGGPVVEATEFGTGIKLGSKEAIVTGFKGNMFTIDGGKFTSVFYDNVQHGKVEQTAAVFTGGCVLTTDPRDEEHGYKVAADSTTGNQKGSARYQITSANNTLVLQPNESPAPVTLTIDDGEYTAAEMAKKLNDLFAANTLDLKAEVITQSVRTTGGRYITFEGLKITSGLKGPDSKVGLDKTSSAYDTLFVSRDYNDYGADRNPYSDPSSNKEASFTGSRVVGATKGSYSFNITYRQAGAAADKTVTLTLASGKSYADADAVVTEINKKIEANSTLKGLLVASNYGGQIRIAGTAAGKMDSVTVSANGTKAGFNELFQGYYSIPVTKEGTGSITLNGKPNNSSMDIVVDGVTHRVTFSSPSPSLTDVKNAINAQIKATAGTAPNTFATVSARGSNGDSNFSSSGQGTSTVTPWSGSATGKGEKKEGTTEIVGNEPASLRLGPKLKSTMNIVAGKNDTLRLTLNGVTQDIKLDAGNSFTPDQLKAHLQSKINAAFGTGMGGAVVDVSNNQLVITSRLPDDEEGKYTSVACDTNGSSFLAWLNTTEGPAKCTSDMKLANSFTLDSSHNSFQYTYTDANGATSTKTVTGLAAKAYTPDTFITELNKKLPDGVKASVSSDGRLVLTSGETGRNVRITYSTRGNGAMDVMFGNLSNPRPAEAVIGRAMQDSITIAAGKQDFKLNINGVPQNITLDTGTYTKAKFIEMLNNKLQAAGADAYLYGGNKIGIRTKATGSTASIYMTYGSGGSSMESIFGTTPTSTLGVKATTSGSTITLTVVDSKGNKVNKDISVSSGTSGGLLPPDTGSSKKPTTKVFGYHSTNKSYVQGIPRSFPLTLDEYSNDLKFTFTDSSKGTPPAETKVDITLDTTKTYATYEDLRKELQDKIDATPGKGKIKVTVNGNGVRLEAVNPSNVYKFKDLSGDFYDKIMCGCTEQKVDLTPANKDGSQKITPKVYVVGRQDVRNEPVEINSGINDELSIDLTYAGKTKPIKITLDPGKYSGDALKDHLQDKIDAALVKEGLKEGLIKVGLGGLNSGVAGGNDANALNFSLADDIAAPEEGEYVLDGVRGNAAFSIFYQTDGKMTPAYIMGTKDVRNGVTIKENETSLSFEVDGDVFEIDLDPGDYRPAELIKMMNEKINAAGAPVAANVDTDTGRVKISHKKMDEHEISWVAGDAKEEVFFEEYGEIDSTVRSIQLSDRHPDHIDLPRSPYSTSLIGVNSLFIAKEKNALKAIDRLSSALRKISELRIKFGSTQNRLEHAIKNNENKTENLEHSDSVIRDTDMAEEMVRHANSNILEQAGISMLSQANQSKQVVLQLLG